MSTTAPAAETEKLTAKLLVRMTPTMKGELAKVAGAEEDMCEIVRRGTQQEINRLKIARSEEAARVERVTKLAERIVRTRGVDIETFLLELEREHTEPELPLGSGAAA